MPNQGGGPRGVNQKTRLFPDFFCDTIPYVLIKNLHRDYDNNKMLKQVKMLLRFTKNLHRNNDNYKMLKQVKMLLRLTQEGWDAI